MANVYFVIIGMLQLIPSISNSNGVPAQLFPLTAVVFISMMKDLFEDWKRHKSDNAENMNKTRIYNTNTKQFEDKNWQDVKVGQIVQIKEDQYFPADLILIKSSDKKGLCYVETKNLDGETNLKQKVVPKYIHRHMKSRKADYSYVMDGFAYCELPNDQIYKFEGSVSLLNYQSKVSASPESLLLRGSSLRNTEWISGIVVYAGHQTKIMMNSANSRFKLSSIEIGTNKQIIFIFMA